MVSCVLKMHRASQLQRLKQLPLARLQMRLALYALAAGLEEGHRATRILHFLLVLGSVATGGIEPAADRCKATWLTDKMSC